MLLLLLVVVLLVLQKISAIAMTEPGAGSDLQGDFSTTLLSPLKLEIVVDDDIIKKV
jgi:hypothetical protein